MDMLAKPDPVIDPADLIHGIARLALDHRSDTGLRFLEDHEAGRRLTVDDLPPHRFTLHVLDSMSAQASLVLGLQLGRRNDLAWIAHPTLPMLLLANLDDVPSRDEATVEDAIPVACVEGIAPALAETIEEGNIHRATEHTWRAEMAPILRHYRHLLGALRRRYAKGSIRLERPHNSSKTIDIRIYGRKENLYDSYTLSATELKGTNCVISRDDEGYHLSIEPTWSQRRDVKNGPIAKCLGPLVDDRLRSTGFTLGPSDALLTSSRSHTTIAKRISQADHAFDLMKQLSDLALGRPFELAAMTQSRAMADLSSVSTNPDYVLPKGSARTLEAAKLLAGQEITDSGRRVLAEYAMLDRRPDGTVSFAEALGLAYLACFDGHLEIGYCSSWRFPTGIPSPRTIPEQRIEDLIHRGLLKDAERDHNNARLVKISDAGLDLFPFPQGHPARTR